MRTAWASSRGEHERLETWGQSWTPEGHAEQGDSRSADVLRKHHRRAIAGTLPPAIEALLWYYAKGKPKEHVELSSDAELLALLDAGRLRNALATRSRESAC